MLLEDIIKPDNVLCDVQARSKKHCLELLSELLTRSDPDLANEEVFELLVDRERLGCTSLGQGVAFPHCRVEGIDHSVGALVRLEAPVDFDSPDGEPVDIILGLLVPEQIDERLQEEISGIAEFLKNPGFLQALRDASTSGGLYKVLFQRNTGAEPGSIRVARAK